MPFNAKSLNYLSFEDVPRESSTVEAQSNAILWVCGASEDATEAREIIDMLGLTEVLKDNYLVGDDF